MNIAKDREYYGLLGTTTSIRVPNHIRSKLYETSILSLRHGYDNKDKDPKDDSTDKDKDPKDDSTDKYQEANLKNHVNMSDKLREVFVNKKLCKLFASKKYQFQTLLELEKMAKVVDSGYAESAFLDFRKKKCETKELDENKTSLWNQRYKNHITTYKKHNEYFLFEDDKNDHVDVLYDIAILLRIRRFQLFGTALAQRMCNVFLPMGVITMKDNAESFLAVPFITLHMKQGKRRFRRTISISLILIPIDNSDNRTLSDKEIFQTLSKYGNDKKFHFVKDDDKLKIFIQTYEQKKNDVKPTEKYKIKEEFKIDRANRTYGVRYSKFNWTKFCGKKRL